MEPYLRAALQKQGFESPTASHQRLDAILSHLVAPGDIQLLQQWASLALGVKGKARGKLGFVLERKPASSQNLGNSHFWNPPEHR